MNVCIYCKGKVQPGKVEHVHKWKGELYLLENLSAEVCKQCGEVYFGPEALDLMDRVATGEIKPSTHKTLPVYSMEGQ